MQGIASLSGRRYAPVIPNVSQPSNLHQVSKPPNNRGTQADQPQFSLGADADQASTSNLTREMATYQTMMETLKAIEERTDGFKSFAEELTNRRQRDNRLVFTLDSNLDSFSQIMDYLQTQVQLLLGQIQAQDNDLMTRMGVEIAMDSSFARDLASHAGEQMRAGLDIILGMDPLERVRIATLLKNDI